MEKEDDFTIWSVKAEKLYTKLSEEYLKMEVGEEYSKKTISILEEKNKKHSELFIERFRTPQELIFDSVNTIAKATTHKLSLKLHELRKTKICIKNIKYNKHPVCWTNWRQFATQTSDKQRKKVFDIFIKKTPAITPVIQNFFETTKKIYTNYNLNPLDVYLQQHKLTVEQLRDVLQKLGDAVKEKFQTEFNKYTKKFLERPPEYYDDFYFMRNIIFEDMTEGFAKVQPQKTVIKLLQDLKFPTQLIHVDAIDRPKKYPSPFCSFVQIPNDIRISYKPENPLQTAIALYHEFGHAAHAISIEPKLPYHKKYILSEGLTETFSIFLENILSDKNYLIQVLGLTQTYATELIERIKFSEHFAISFYIANSLLKIDQWEKNLTIKQMNEAYAQYLKTWLGLDVPGEYWQLHHILPEALMYVPSYLLAMIRANELTEMLKNKYGTWWWAHKRSGDELRNIMQPGADSPISDFSKLDIQAYIKTI